MSLQPSDVVTHLQKYLPVFTDKFTDSLTVGSAVASGLTVTVTATAHGLSVGNIIGVMAGQFSNLLASVVDNGDGTVRFQTAQQHDLTEPQLPGDPTTLTLSGFGNAWDGTFNIFAVPNREYFEIEYPAGETVPPTLGTGFLQENRPAGIIGNQTVDSVPDADTFTFTASGVPDFPDGAVIGFSTTTSFRIYGAATFQRANDFYNKELTGKYALFVIMGDTVVSKDRHTENDGLMTATAQNEMKQTILTNFSTVVFFPTSDDLAGNAAVNEAFGEIYNSLLSSLYGFTFDSTDECGDLINYATVSAGHGQGEYNTAYYVHVYDWQRPDAIDIQQGFNFSRDVAFRDIYGTVNLFGDSEAELQFGIDLDDEPI